MASEAENIRKRLEKRWRRGFRGYPIGTIAYYGPDDKTASKVTVGIVFHPEGEPHHLKRWLSTDIDVRESAAIMAEVDEHIKVHKVASLSITPGIWGCPHEEGEDYPEGQDCPYCPFWVGRDRDAIFTEIEWK